MPLRSWHISIQLSYANTTIETAEGLHLGIALVIHTRNRFIINLLPLLEAAKSLRRVVTVFAATKESPIDMKNLHLWNMSIRNISTGRGHMSSCITLSLEALAKKAPTVSFIHDFPGPVRSNVARGRSLLLLAIQAIFVVIAPFVCIPNEESGERHLFLATSARYPPGKNTEASSGVCLEDGDEVARGTDAQNGSGVYSVDEHGESADPKVEELLADFRKEGLVEKVWEHCEDEYKRITGGVELQVT
jgi:hypothetical protein